MTNAIRNFITVFLSVALLFFFVTGVYANHILAPVGYVNDFAGVLTSDQKNTLENSLKDYEQQTTNEIAVATVKSLDGQDITDFTVKTFEEWKIGKETRDNGILFLAAIDDRKMRIEVGYGLEPNLTDSQAGEIIRNIIAPEFKKENYYQGIRNGVTAIQNRIGNHEESPSRGSYATVDQIISGLGAIGVLILGSVFVLSLIGIFMWKSVLKKDIPKSKVRLKVLMFFLITIFGGYYLIRGGLLIVIFAVVLVVIVYFFSFLARSKSIWLGGLVGLFLGIILGFLSKSVQIGAVCSMLFGALGLLLDWRLSANYSKLKKAGKSTNWWVTGGGFFGSGNSGGFGGGSSGGGGASGSW